ncbi:MAG: hypothetical protein CMP10_12325 [Zetaproteobacteria bacterium]|nr:hypothetical protein [Pseudobdellovibrionaceae bacterium]|tara:strand:- start:194 stop:694 length:501 start_codon:yes stop_codon:yes gene_type:complete
MEKKSIKYGINRFLPIIYIIVLGCNDINLDHRSAVDQPERTKVSADRGTMKKWGEIETQGRLNLKAKIIIPLDYILQDSSEKGVIPGCYKALTNSFGSIGLVKCLDRDLSIPINIGHVFQECYNNPAVTKIYPTKKFDLKTCKRIEVLGFNFVPPLQIDIEPKVLK